MLEKLESKLAAIKADIDQSVANHNALLGAKQVVEQLIDDAKKDNINASIESESVPL